MRLVQARAAFHWAFCVTWCICVWRTHADSLYIGDVLDDSVKRFDATTGAFVDSFIPSGSNGLFGPRGMVFDVNHDLLLVDQNVGQPLNGEVLRFSGMDGSALPVFVPDALAPLAPRGMVLSPDRTVLYVADMGDFPAEAEPIPGGISRYDAKTGALIDQLPAPNLEVGFHPRGLVFGRDGMLYASNFEPPGPNASGSILRFDPSMGEYVDEFVSRHASSLLRSEGIAFSPTGDLFATSFRAHAGDVDRILQFDGRTGDLVKSIETDEVGGPRNLPGQGLLFGPGGSLYVPIITLDADPNTGAPVPVSSEVRRYDVESGTFDLLVPPGGPLFWPFYLTFDATDPSTLAYFPGDFNHDGYLGHQDINALTRIVVAGTHDQRFDLNGDRRVDNGDRVVWVADLAGLWFGDTNMDGLFTSRDLSEAWNYGAYETDIAATWESGDWDGDLRFDSGDLVTAFVDGGYERGHRGSMSSVPEPTGGLILSCLALAAIWSGSRRKHVTTRRVVS